jgi:hypothetical protein
LRFKKKSSRVAVSFGCLPNHREPGDAVLDIPEKNLLLVCLALKKDCRVCTEMQGEGENEFFALCMAGNVLFCSPFISMCCSQFIVTKGHKLIRLLIGNESSYLITENTTQNNKILVFSKEY